MDFSTRAAGLFPVNGEIYRADTGETKGATGAEQIPTKSLDVRLNDWLAAVEHVAVAVAEIALLLLLNWQSQISGITADLWKYLGLILLLTCATNNDFALDLIELWRCSATLILGLQEKV